MYMYGASGGGGSIRVTEDKALGSGNPVIVYSATWLSDGTGRDLVLRNGTSASGDIYVQAAGTASKTVTQNWEGGLLFPDGCFIDYTASTVSVVLQYEVLK